MNNYKLSNFNFGRAFIYLILIFFALIYLAPLYVMFTTSLKDIEEIRSGNLMALPLDPTLYAWKKAWSSACTGSECQGLAPYFWNSVRIVVPAVIISTVVGAFNGYALAKWKFKGSELLFGALLFGCFIPFQVILLPMAKLLGELGLANTVTGLVLVHVIYGVAFTTLFFRNYYVGIPTELVKAAKLDGAGFLSIFRHIFIPLSTPIFVVTIIWQFTQIWNDFLFGVVDCVVDLLQVDFINNIKRGHNTSFLRFDNFNISHENLRSSDLVRRCAVKPRTLILDADTCG